MQITVCVAIPASTDTKIKIVSGQNTIDATDVKYELNPYDDFAVEQALRIKDQLGGQAEVVILHVGDGNQQKEEMRKCLARGADRAVLLKADTSSTDSSGIASALSTSVKGGTSRMVLFGKQAVDGDNGQVPYHVARELGWPVVAKVSRFKLDGERFEAQREIEGGIEVIEGSLPVVLTAEKGLAEIRYPSLKGIMAAKKKPFEEVAAAVTPALLVTEKLELPPPRPEGRIVGEGAGAVASLIDALKNEAKVI